MCVEHRVKNRSESLYVQVMAKTLLVEKFKFSNVSQTLPLARCFRNYGYPQVDLQHKKNVHCRIFCVTCIEGTALQNILKHIDFICWFCEKFSLGF